MRVLNHLIRFRVHLVAKCNIPVKNISINSLPEPLFARIMSQKSITSFFAKTPRKSEEPLKTDVKFDKENSSIKTELNGSPKEVKKGSIIPEKPTKRSRSDSDVSEESVKSRSNSPEIKANAKKNKKRQRIESSSDSNSSPVKVPKDVSQRIIKAEKKSPEASQKTKKVKKSSPERVEDETSKKVKLENKSQASPKTGDMKQTSPKRPNDGTSKKIKVDESPKGKKVSQCNNVEKENIVQPKATLNSFFQKKDVKANGKSDKGEIEKPYDPQKSKYDPIKDASWSRGEPVPYLALAKTLEAIEATSARLRIIEILSNFFRSVIVLSPEDMVPCVYMCLNKLAPAYESLELGVAETYLMKAIGQSTGKSLAQVKSDAAKVGDLGLVAEQSKSTQRMMFKPAPLTVKKVFGALKEIAGMTGNTAMNKKVSKIQSTFVACRESEARYLIRSLAGKLRIGLAEQSVLQAIALATLMTPPCPDWPPKVLDGSKGISPESFKSLLDEQALIVKTTYCECPNYDKIIPTILEFGVTALPEHCRLTPGIPLKPMLAHPTKGISEVFERFENLLFTCEWKYDGERAQIHIPAGQDGNADLGKASIFSRNQENNTSKYPDVIGRLSNLVKETVKSCVLDCEAVAWDVEEKRILPFQKLSTRKRKDASIGDIKVQVCLFIFDLLYLNGEALVKEPLQRRRELLRENFKEVEGEWLYATSKDCSTMEEVQEFLDESIKGSCEGLMVKTLEGKDATYEIAKRSRNWLKLKKDYLEGVGDTLDVVVIGGYHGRGKRTGVYGGFLLACYDPDSEEYQSICKIGTGFSDESLSDHTKSLEEHKIDGPKNYYRYDSSHEPDVWFAPSSVWEIKCADLSLSPVHRAAIGLVEADKGISLRFPRFIRIRDDKTPEEATSARQVADIYLNQDQVKNQGNSNKHIEEDFY